MPREFLRKCSLPVLGVLTVGIILVGVARKPRGGSGDNARLLSVMPPSTQPVQRGEGGSPSDQSETISSRAWQQLTGQVAGRPRLLVALNGGASVRIDGYLDEPVWQEGFETVLPDDEDGGVAKGVRARACYRAGDLYVALHGRRWSDDPLTSRPDVFVTLFVCRGDPACRIRLTAGSDGTWYSFRTTVESCEQVPDSNGAGVVRWADAGTWTAEVKLSGELWSDRVFGHGDTLELAVRVDVEPPERPDGNAPAYWFYEAVQPTAVRIVLLDRARDDWPTVRGVDGVIDPSGVAIQWKMDSVQIRPGETVRGVVNWVTKDSQSLGRLFARLLPADGLETKAPVGRFELTASGRPGGGVVGGPLALPPPGSAGLWCIELFSEGGVFPSEPVRIPVLVCTDWKRLCRSHLFEIRADVEKDTSQPLWNRSIVTAHVVRVLERLDRTRGLSGCFLSMLYDLHRALAAWAEGRVPDLPTGVSRVQCMDRFGRPVSFAVQVPGHYDARLAWPFYRGQLGLPHMIGVKATHETDLILSHLQSLLNLDSDRFYLVSWCGDAYDAADLLVQQPHRWAAAVLSLRVKWTPLLPNARHVPVLFYNHDRPGTDTRVLKTAVAWMRAQGCDVHYEVLPSYGHEPIPARYLPQTARWLLTHRRRTPERVDFVTDGYWCRRNYWVSIDAIGEESRLAGISAELRGDRVYVTTNGNVRGYTLHLDQAPFSPGVRRVEIVEDGTTVARVDLDQEPKWYSRKPSDAGDGVRRKSPEMPGTIGDALATRDFVVVWGGSGADLRLCRAARRLSEQLAADARRIRVTHVISDRELGSESAAESDLILIGSSVSNRWIGQLKGRLPVQWQGDLVHAGSSAYDLHRVGMLLLYPNPLNPDRYALVICSADAKILERLGASIRDQLDSVYPFDWVVGRPRGGSMRMEWVFADRFDWAWRPTRPGPALAVLKEAHPQWQWEQWIARLVCERIGCDVFFSGCLFQRSPASLKGPISAWDIYRCVRNDWLFFTEVESCWLWPRLMLRLHEGPGAVVAFRDENEASAFWRFCDASGEGRQRPITAARRLRVALPNEGGFFRPVPAAPRREGRGWWGGEIYNSALACVLSEVFVADCVVRFLQDHRGLNLDAVLSGQPRRRVGGHEDVVDLLEQGVR